MNNPIISAQTAEEINEKVQRLIDPKLFLFCNYSPTRVYSFSEDGAYLVAIQDLYKFAIDTSPILKKIHIILPKGSVYQFQDLKRSIECVDMLRSVLDHSQNILNGLEQKKRLDEFLLWQQSVLHTNSEPQTNEDFAKLYAELERIAQTLLAQVDKLVRMIAALPLKEKEESVRKWIDILLAWYGSNTKTEIYKGILADLYISKAQVANPYFLDNIGSSNNIYRKIGSWIGEMMPDYAKDGSWSPNKESVNASYKALADMLKETFDELVAEGEEFTLLPQDFLYLDAEKRFDLVPSPENDW